MHLIPEQLRSAEAETQSFLEPNDHRFGIIGSLSAVIPGDMVEHDILLCSDLATTRALPVLFPGWADLRHR